jgi:hypothetical protein
MDSKVLFVTIGAVVEGIPKANLFYRVHIPKDAIRQTPHVIGYKWYEADALKELYLSPSVSDVMEDLAKLLSPNVQAGSGHTL